MSILPRFQTGGIACVPEQGDNPHNPHHPNKVAKEVKESDLDTPALRENTRRVAIEGRPLRLVAFSIPHPL
jgi:hypothetical protein